MDYYMWRTVKKDTTRTACNTEAKVIDRIKEAYEALPSGHREGRMCQIPELDGRC